MSIRQQLGFDPCLMALWDATVTGCELVLDDNDSRPWHERLESDLNTILDELFAGLNLDESIRRLEEIAAPQSGVIPGWIKRFGGEPSATKYFIRAVGSGRYYRVRKAMKADAAVVMIGVRRLLRWFLPFTVAVDDCASLLTVDQLTAIYEACAQPGTKPAAINDSLLRLLLMLDEQIDRLVKFGVPLPEATARVDERHHLDVADQAAFVDQLRTVVSGQSRTLVVELSQALTNKIQGARDAMQYSADPVSQAANSLIELIDRLLRGAFPEAFVLKWTAENLPDERNAAYTTKEGLTKPTKRAQAFCFAYAGQKIQQRSALNEIAAVGLVIARKQLEQLKHADTGSTEEQKRLYGLLSAVEAYIVVAIRLGWSIHANDADLDQLRSRLVAAA
jgi:hypothetical protein